MSKREIILALTTACMLLLLCGAYLVNRMIISPLDEAKTSHRALHKKVMKSEDKLFVTRKDANWLRQIADQQYDGDEDEITAALRLQILKAAEEAGMDSPMTLKPVNGKRIRNGYAERGWTIQTNTTLNTALIFLRLLEASPELTRVRNLSIAPDLKQGLVTLNFKYMTIIYDAPTAFASAKSRNKSKPGTTNESSNNNPTVNTDQPFHDMLNKVATRDIFRPYIQKEPEPVRPKTVTKKPTPKPTPKSRPKPKPPAEDRFIITGLPSWGNQVEIYLQDPINGATSVLKLKDSVLGGKIIGIDYRPKPHPADSMIISSSRLTLLLDGELYTIELGDSLKDRVKTKLSDLTDQHRVLATPLMPAQTSKEDTAGKNDNMPTTQPAMTGSNS